MVEKFSLKIESREQRKPNQLRRAGKIPATLYGHGTASVNVQVSDRDFSRLPTAAYSHIVQLEGGPDQKPVAAIIRNVQREHTTQKVLNIEFYRVAADRKVTMAVPLKFVGESAAVQAGGQLLENFTEAEVECLPGDIPDFIEVDLSKITEPDQGIHFSQLTPPAGVVILNPAEEIVARVVAKKAVAAEGELAAPGSTDTAPAATSA